MYPETRAALTLTEIAVAIQLEYGPYKYNTNNFNNGRPDRRHGYNRTLASVLDPHRVSCAQNRHPSSQRYKI